MSTLQRIPLVLCALLALVPPGCASRPPIEATSPETELSRGLEALRLGDYRTAHTVLDQLAAHPVGHPAGDQARLVLAAIALDPRNPSRRLDAAAAYAAELIRPADNSGTRPLAETLYLLALDLGARAPAGADTTPLPFLPDTPFAARMRGLAQERDSLRHQVATLEQHVQRAGLELRQKDQELAKLAQELERIRRTLRH